VVFCDVYRFSIRPLFPRDDLTCCSHSVESEPPDAWKKYGMAVVCCVLFAVLLAAETWIVVECVLTSRTGLDKDGIMEKTSARVHDPSVFRFCAYGAMVTALEKNDVNLLVLTPWVDVATGRTTP
jgi:hypothetical protein